MLKKIERLFRQDMVRIVFDVEYSENLWVPEEEKQFLWSNVVNEWESADCKTKLLITAGHAALIEGCGENLQKAVGELKYYISKFNNNLVYMVIIIDRIDEM